MKILKYIIYALAAFIILFLSVGILKPEINYGHEITVNKSIKEAWAVHQDQAKLGQWLEGFKSIELISGEPGTVGSKYKVVVKPEETQPDFVMTETIKSLKEFDHIDLNFDSEMMQFDKKTLFSEADGKTTIKTESKVVGSNLFMRSVFGLMAMLGNTFQTQEVKHIENLKKVIEENTTDYYPVVQEEEEIQTESEE